MPKSIQVIVFEAIDGKRFDDIEKCREYEVDILDRLLKTLTPEHIRDALKRAGLSVRADRSVKPADGAELKATIQEFAKTEARVQA